MKDKLSRPLKVWRDEFHNHFSDLVDLDLSNRELIQAHVIVTGQLVWNNPGDWMPGYTEHEKNLMKEAVEHLKQAQSLLQRAANFAKEREEQSERMKYAMQGR